MNCIKQGIVPTKYCEKSKEELASANGTALNISYKLNKGYIKADGYCFKNTFLIVDNMTSDLILGTPFLTQIYPFYVNEVGLHTKIMGSLLEKKLIRPSKSPWSCEAFYVNNALEKERGVPRLVINYKPLNKALQ